MDLHIIVLSLLGAVVVGLVLLVIRLLRHRRKSRNLDAVVSKAVAQMRETGIFLSLGLNPEPEDIKRLQLELQPWGYLGDVDGLPNIEMLAAIDRQATARGVDVDSEVQNLFPPARYTEVLPESIQHDIILTTAQERLATSAAPVRHRGHRIA